MYSQLDLTGWGSMEKMVGFKKINKNTAAAWTKSTKKKKRKCEILGN